ncbi:hypothetical protein HMPREF0322_01179 [Desulfitobacterium hafniense DP7]|uniref:Toxin-antitoxin system, toxin component, RelE domain protein n=1 Tax=Desulfitobacterium hafniense DP7 TaxID=537010 RepID=G9XJP8_DESHA|nr:hypothetical protein [Desulfitobacterium hafniense]EHL08192.1 hypothetical protein HMPREF0322_01179 [Desulfitobacterium hafniense DP7]
MEYEVKLTFLTTAQIQEAISYISKTLLEPEIARRWGDSLQKEISSLATMPQA